MAPDVDTVEGATEAPDLIAPDIATPPAVDPAPAQTSAAVAHLTAGHGIIKNFEARAQQLASTYPVIKFLLPQISAALHDLLTHIASTPGLNPVLAAVVKDGAELVPVVEHELQTSLTLTPPPASDGAAA